jgi:RNA polymerase sigma factor (sigma-70 family)
MKRTKPLSAASQLEALYQSTVTAGMTDSALLQRFLDRRDPASEAAFEALVLRHGPMVMATCRRVLRNETDAADAFQATFLILAHKAATIRQPSTLSTWLHRVARQTGYRAKLRSQNRKLREQAVVSSTEHLIEAQFHDVDRHELQSILDEELDQLPETFRAPLVLCYLDGLTHDEAASSLGCPVGTIRSRLSRGRDRLRARLTRRGFSPSDFASIVIALPPVSAVLVTTTVSTASLMGGGTLASLSKLAVPVLTLVQGVLRVMFFQNVSKAALSLAVITILGMGAFVTARSRSAQAEKPIAKVTADITTTNNLESEIAYVNGKVLDETDKPVIGAVVRDLSISKQSAVVSDQNGEFRVPLMITTNGQIRSRVVSQSPDGRLGFLYISQLPNRLQPIRVVVKPPQVIEIKVVDETSKPVEFANVHFLTREFEVAEGVTDAAGRWLAHVPSGTTEWRSYAHKSRVGFDYALSSPVPGRDSTDLLPKQLTLTLDGAHRPVRVKTVDATGHPLSGVEVGPTFLWKSGRFNGIIRNDEHFTKTDANGIAVFDWLPAKSDQSQVFRVAARSIRDRYPIDRETRFNQTMPTEDLKITLLPMQILAGRISTPDGTPVANAIVNAQGEGPGSNGFRGETRTDQEGRYRFKAYSGQGYILTAKKERMAAPYRSVVLRSGKPMEDVDLVLDSGTMVKGRVTTGKDHEPYPKTTVLIKIDKGRLPSDLELEGTSRFHRLHMDTFLWTDNDGRFEVVLGPGDYQFSGPDGWLRNEFVNLKIPVKNAPREIIQDFHLDRPLFGSLKITVVDNAGNRASGALVDGYAEGGNPQFVLPTDAQGALETSSMSVSRVLRASSPDKSQIGLTRVSADATTAKVVLQPVTSVSFRVVDPQNKPIVGLKINYGITVPIYQPRPDLVILAFGGTCITDASGRVKLENLILGETYELQTFDTATKLRFAANRKLHPLISPFMEIGEVVMDLRPERAIQIKPDVPHQEPESKKP